MTVEARILLIEVFIAMVRRTKEEALETRSKILEAAEQAFYERGVARTTLADIATLAGVTRGAIYWHFSNKAELVEAMLDSLNEPLDEMARASESENEVDPLGCMRQLLIHLFRQVAIDPKTRRINEILFHKCEFTDEMCDLRAQRQMAMLDCNSRIELALSNAIHRQQLPEIWMFAVLPSACMPISTEYSDNGCWFPTALTCTHTRNPGSIRGWTCCAQAQL